MKTRSSCGSAPASISAASLFCCLLAATILQATDVAFWSEYQPTKQDATQTYLLLQFNETPLQAFGPVERIETLGRATVVDEGRFGRALRLDGASGVR